MGENDFGTGWALKWAEGTIVGFARGRIELNRAAGMLRRSAELIGDDRLSAIIKNIEENPIYLPGMTVAEKVAKLKPLRKALEAGKSAKSRQQTRRQG